MKRSAEEPAGPRAADRKAVLLSLGAELHPCNAVAALLVLDDGRYVMQLRDSIPGIFYPGHWGCFGGALDPDEEPADALKRELREELEFDMHAASKFTQFDFDFSALGGSKVFRTYYEVGVSAAAFERFVLHEGTDMRAFAGEKLLTSQAVAPYDSFALWMHMRKARLAA